MTTLLPVDDIDAFVSTRNALHRIAEHIVAKARYVDDGEIRLTAFAGGFSTPLLGDGSRIRVDGEVLVVDEPTGSRRTSLTTIGEAAAFVGIEAGFPSELYPPATTFEPADPLAVDRSAAETLAAWYALTAEVLEQFAREIADAHPSPLILWPEHFDQAFYTEDAEEARRANYGASAGDEGHPEPYMYVGPWGTSLANAYWNATSFNGAVLSLSQLVTVDNPTEVALQFLRTGRALLSGATSRHE